ncbi:MAG: transposase [Bacillota bacterium]
MPRIARERSVTSVYHIMMRGNNRQKIFNDVEDKDRISEIIYKKIATDGAVLYAYCIMDNHLHMIVREANITISHTIKRIGTSYAWFFNKKYVKIGHVFQDRFKSEVIESDSRLLAAIRYVHKNPAKAGISDLDSYKWSSYNKYLNLNFANDPGIKEILNMSSINLHRARETFIKFHENKADEEFIDIKELSPEEARLMVDNYLENAGISKGKLKSREHKIIRENLVLELVRRSDLSLREIALMLGINRETVRIIVSKEPSL